MISDGGDNASKLKLADVLKKAEESSAVIYTIGIFDDADEDKNPDVLRRLARATGGEAFFPAHLEEVVANCESIARDIRHQYTLGYVPTSEANAGAYRKVRVEARAEGIPELAGAHAIRLHQMRLLRNVLLGIAVLSLGYCGFVLADSWVFQYRASRQFGQALHAPPVAGEDPPADLEGNSGTD